MLTDSSRAADFPSLNGIHYLNTAAESIPPVCVNEAVNEYMQHKSLGMRGRDFHFPRVEACREITAKHLGLATNEVSFCSCSSEAYNLLASALDLTPNDEVVVTDLDFPAGATPWLTAPEHARPVSHLWKNNHGALNLVDLASLLSERTKLVQVSLVSFYNGHRIAYAKLRDMVRLLAPNAVLAVDVTQALGRVVLDCQDADILISSTHKWTLGIHGGGIIGIPKKSAARLTTKAGGWYHISNAFDADRFESARVKSGALSFSVGMPSFAALYALNASLRYLDQIGVATIAAHADPLVARVHAGLKELGITTLCPAQPDNPSGIVAFTHENTAAINEALLAGNIHVMHQVGRIRIAIHGYNTAADVDKLLATLRSAL
ncbi:aminotransferase class V-fold PLP-dependent enzyme [Prosthecobacter sp.]|uniref:aminotransferase class V-fold PLP-dependent enzyme n=1 Tax=Prosthecobacter sp. TaxID=1965333 RepID=UPI001D45E294|nr:aminotransferase class V-fold PLP-dependent enzyme [Prosthecobacter sp.]MCB1277254.1 aminotransferase class V-fold PLP-dependent enzyme [Prosthecobacter sp.]